MEGSARIRWPVGLQHFLDQIDSSARTVEFVSCQQIGRTSRRAESAMNAGAQNLLGFGSVRIAELCEREMRLHWTSKLRTHATALENMRRIKAFFYSPSQARKRIRLRMKDLDDAAHVFACTDERCVTAYPVHRGVD